MSVNYAEQYILVKGYIDAKDERQRTFYGTFMAVVSRRDTLYLGVMFGSEEIPKETDFDALYDALTSRAQAPDDAAFSHNESELYKFLDVSRTLNGVARSRNLKQAEQAISRFCADTLHLKAVTFVFFEDAMKSQLARFAHEKKETPESSSAEMPEAADSEESAAAEPSAEKAPRDLIVRCEPVLDPVRGVAMSDLNVGDTVCARLPDDSIFYKMFVKNFQGFDGVITAQVNGILVNELGTAIVSLQLADDVSGVMKMSGKVKVKMADRQTAAGDGSRHWLNLQTLPPELVFAAATIFVLLCAIGLIVYLFGTNL